MEEYQSPPQGNEPPPTKLREPEVVTTPVEADAAQDVQGAPAASPPARKDPMPLRLASVLTFMFAALNVLGGFTALIAWVGGQSVGTAGAMMLTVLLLPIGLLQALSAIMLLKYAKAPDDKIKGLCRNLGIAMLFITVVYMVPYFMIFRTFATSLLPGPIIAVVYLAVLK